MGKAAQRKRASRSTEQGGADVLDEYELLKSARQHLQRAVPSTFTHNGRTYCMRVIFGEVGLMVFDSTTSRQPIAYAITGSSDQCGHQPDN
jgi:hypothetical protein